METIHKKNGRLHIYVRQDKYKGELKSHNWVGRTYINGKQKIVSSGTSDLEKATVILEKWFDDLQVKKEEKQIESTAENNKTQTLDNVTRAETKTPKKIENQTTSNPNQQENISSSSKEKTDIFSKLKNIKFTRSNLSKSSGATKKNKFTEKMKNIFQSKVSKMSVAGEEIVGVDISPESIHVAQVNKDKNDKWILDKFSYRLLDKAKIGDNLIENKDYLSDEIKLALANAKITSTNVALSIPVTSAIIRVVTSPLMTEEELKKAIETDSLWENLVQLTENMNDYSVFHQVINRNTKNNTMDILFVASKLSDVNAFSAIVKKSNLNPVIMDVRCFTLKNALDNLAFGASSKMSTAIMEFGTEENYLMIIHKNIPIITDIFLRPQEKQSILNADPNKENDESKDVIRRYSMQIKQAIAEYEGKYDAKINSISVVSGLKNIRDLVPLFTKNLPTTGFKLFDPMTTIAIPSYNTAKTNLENKSVFTSVLGLAFRKLDVFGYYKFVTAVKNINLLPDRSGMIKQKKMKAFSNFAYKGLVGGVIGIYLILFTLAFWNINRYNSQLTVYNTVVIEHEKATKEKAKIEKELGVILTTLKLSKSLKSNKDASYRILAQIASSVPKRVKFESVEYNGIDQVIIQGVAATDKDILKLITNLGKQKMVKQASLASMNLPRTSGAGQVLKGFRVFVRVKG